MEEQDEWKGIEERQRKKNELVCRIIKFIEKEYKKIGEDIIGTVRGKNQLIVTIPKGSRLKAGDTVKIVKVEVILKEMT